MDFLEYPEVFKEEKGAMNPGRLKLTNQSVIFKNNKTGKVDQVQGTDIETVNWQRIAAAFGLRILTKNGALYRFGGFSENDHDKLTKYFSTNFEQEMKNKEMSIKGWNYGTAKFQGPAMSFDVERCSAFEIPLSNVSHCVSAKNEVTMEFHQNDEAAVSLMELRFHIPINADADTDPVHAFVENVLASASIIQATGDAIVTFKELQCLTPRGRYDIKIFPSFIQLHGKTFDYKIPLTTVLRLFLLPHKDGRQMFFVLSLDPPIKHGQTRYHFLILLFSKDEETNVELRLTETDIKEKYEDKLQKEMSGPTFEIISRVMKALVQRKINIPGSFKGHSGTQAISCSYKAANGLLYPLERGLIYVHKPAVHIRFEEMSFVNFARSGGSTRSFDFEIETKNGVIHTFSSIEKEEYTRLFDFVNSKKLRIKNRNTGITSKQKPTYNDDEIVDSDVEDEPDAYLVRMKAEGIERDKGGGSTDEESSDESFAPEESGSEVAEEYDSNPPTSSDSDDDEDDKSGSSSAGDKPKPKKSKEDKPKKSRSAKTVKEPAMRKKRQKKERDENKPKRPPSAYFVYLGEMREKIKKDNPGIAVTELSKKAGEMWKEVKDKSKWEEKAGELKKEYEKKMAEYKASGGGGEEPKSKQKSEKGKKSPTKSPTKPSGSFKSKEYVSSSGSSSDSDDKKKSSKKKKGDEKMDVDEDEGSNKSASPSAASSAASESD